MRIARPGAFVVVLACVATLGHAATFTVDTTADAVDAAIGDGQCATLAGACSLRAAVQEANADATPDEVLLPSGIFLLDLAGTNEDLAATGDLDVRAPLALRGAGASATTIDGAALDRVLDLHAPAGANGVSLAALALANGRSTAVLGQSAGLGLRVAAGVAVTATDVDVRDNLATQAFGGGIGIDNRGCFTGLRVRVLRNVDPASPGSARALAGGVTTRGAASCFVLEDGEVSDNVGDQAGAFYADGGAPITLRRSLVAGNRARFAGAFELNGGNEVLLEDTTVSGNRGNPGAALVDGGANLRLRHCTVTGNGPAQSSATIGGIQDVHGGFGRTFLTNTILAGNGPGFQSADCSNLRSAGGGNIIGSVAGCNASLLPSDRTGIDPGLAPLADNGGATRTHLPGPAALDSATEAGCTARDQRSVVRPQDGDGDGSAACDVGAVEIGEGVLFANGFE
jgi:CSLREA domain-containing protein